MNVAKTKVKEVNEDGAIAGAFTTAAASLACDKPLFVESHYDIDSDTTSSQRDLMDPVDNSEDSLLLDSPIDTPYHPDDHLVASIVDTYP